MSANKKKVAKKPARKKVISKKTNVLNVGHFGKSGGKDAHESDPVRETTIVLTLDELEFYDRNPRQQDNRQFEEIKESIKVNGGLTSVLVVTRRPGSPKFMVAAGGNTRLKALQEIHAETDDKTFFEIRANFRPWENETKILVNHLIENELRDDLTFIDQAIAIKGLKADLEKEVGESLSLRKLSAELKRIGYPKHNSLLSKLFYASDTLDFLIPKTLRGASTGSTALGKPQIEKIRKLENTFQKIWEARVSETKGPFSLAFETTMQSLDKMGDFSIDNLRHELLLAVADAAGLPGHYIELDYKRALSDTPLADVAGPVNGDDHAQSDQVPGEQEQEAQATAQPGRPRREREYDGDTPTVYLDTTDGPLGKSPSTIRKQSTKTSLKELRELAHITAQSFAVDARLDVVSPYEYGMGYLVDYPQDSLAYNGDDKQLLHAASLRQLVWWLLLFASEIITCDEPYGDSFPEDYRFREMFEKDSKTGFEHVGGAFLYMNLGHYLQSPAFESFEDNYHELTRLGRLIRGILDDPNGSYIRWPEVGNE